MTLWQQCEQLYEKENHNFLDDVILYSQQHYAHLTPDCIILARLEENQWFIHLAVGTGCLPYFLRIMPIYRPYVSWARPFKGRKEVKVFSTEKLKRLIL